MGAGQTISPRLLPGKESRVEKEKNNQKFTTRSSEREKNKKLKMALSSRLRLLLLAAVAALLALVALVPTALAANTLMAVDLGGEFMKVR